MERAGARGPRRTLAVQEPPFGCNVPNSPTIQARAPGANTRDGAVSTAPRAVYVHVPFCRHRCGYCDFTLIAGRDDLIADYLHALRSEIAAAIDAPIDVDTLFLGGGTPSHLAPEQLEQLFGMLFERFRPAVGAEISIEANPADVTPQRVAVLAEAGVNRISLGVQSFDEAVLRTLERDHTAETVRRAVAEVRARIENVALDLIFGVPGQSEAVWEQTLQQAIALRPAHVSTYGLTWEKGTSFWGRRRKGDLVPAAEETERTMYARAMDALAAAGLEQYELSNFARRGFRCRHNETYWRGGDYLAFGPGAARYVGGVRETSHRSVTTWLKRVQAGRSPTAFREQLPPEEAARERLVIGLRLTAGVPLDAFEHQTGYTVDDLGADVIERHISAGLLERTPTHLRLSRAGRFLADSVIVELV